MPLDGLFPEQLEILRHPARFKALLCGRAAGKTETMLRDFVHGMQTKPHSQWLFAASTRGAAKNILWEPLRTLNEINGWGLKLNETELRARHPNGSWLVLAGMDSRPELEKARGIPWDGVKIDECGSHKPSYLQYYVEEVIMPRLIDRNGTLWLAGTPTRAAHGFFYKVTTKHASTGAWAVRHWTAQQNPYIDWQRYIYHPVEGILALRGWDEENPIFRREYLGQWQIDSQSAVFRFNRVKNILDALPLLCAGDRWIKALSYDFGVGDATACAVIAWPERFGRFVCIEHTWQARGLAPSDAVDLIEADMKRFHPKHLIGDLNGLGKGYEREWNKRFPGVAMRAAEKAHKRAAIEVTSDLLHVAVKSEEWQQRRGLFSLRDNEELHNQWATLQWDEERKDIAEGQDDDISHAAMYGVRLSPAFQNTQEEPPPPPPPGKFDPFTQRKVIHPTEKTINGAFKGAFRGGR